MPEQFEKFTPQEELGRLKPSRPETKKPIKLTKERDEHFLDLLTKAKQAEKQGNLERAIELYQQYKEEYQDLREEKEGKEKKEKIMKIMNI